MYLGHVSYSLFPLFFSPFCKADTGSFIISPVLCFIKSGFLNLQSLKNQCSFIISVIVTVFQSHKRLLVGLERTQSFLHPVAQRQGNSPFYKTKSGFFLIHPVFCFMEYDSVKNHLTTAFYGMIFKNLSVKD